MNCVLYVITLLSATNSIKIKVDTIIIASVELKHIKVKGNAETSIREKTISLYYLYRTVIK